MQLHNQNQPASTCSQCGEPFNRKDNLLKHMKHCTGHRPPPQLPPQQQQQHTTAPPPPTFTISHQYTSMGGAAINRPPPPTSTNENLPKQTPCLQIPSSHHDCVSQGCGPECCHTTARNDCCICSRCCTATRQRQPAATQLHRGIRIERIGVGELSSMSTEPYWLARILRRMHTAE